MTDREKCGLEVVKVLSRGMPKGGHVGEERLDVGWFERLEKDMSIICILVTMEELTRASFNTNNRAHAEPT